jgi:hypothetical protein
MAKSKDSLASYCLAQVALLISTLVCCIILVVLQKKCLNAKKDDIVESYCSTDNRMRAVVSFILAILILIIADSLSRAVKSFRTYKLVNGINEGTFIAMTSGFLYRLKAMKSKKWTILILAVVLLEVIPAYWQIITTYAITTVIVIVKDGGSTAEIYNRGINYGGGVNRLRNWPNRLIGSESLLPSVGVLTNQGVSEMVGGKVMTSVVRDALAPNVSSSGFKDDLSFIYTDVVATIVTSCDTIRRENTAFPENISAPYAKKMDSSTGMGGAVSVTSSYTIVGNKSIFKVNKDFIYCQGENKCNVTHTTCTSDLSLARQKVIYVINTRKVSPIKNIDDNATVSIQDFANLTNILVNAPEQIAFSLSTALGLDLGSDLGLDLGSGDIVGDFGDIIDKVLNAPLSGRKLLGMAGVDTSINYVVDSVLVSSISIGTGMFNNSFENELHARVCSAASISLRNLFAFSAISGDNDLNSLYSGLQKIDLYTPIPQAYMPVYFVWIIVAFFLTFVVVLITIDFFSFMMSPVNIKETNELALIDNIGRSMAAKRSNYHLSNDTDEQNVVSFRHNMYIREENTLSGKKVMIEYEDNGMVPNKSIPYE